MDVRMAGKTVMITGANTGIGKTTAIGIAKTGARVILACRSQVRAEEARQDIVSESGNEDVHFRELDLGSLQSVRSFAQKYIEEEPRLDILICNAGIFTRKRQLTAEGYEMMFGVNHLGHFLLTNLLLDKLKACAPSRVVLVSSLAHEENPVNFDDLQNSKSFSGLSVYGQSKTCNVLFVVKLAQLLAGSGVTTYALHPGFVQTELVRDVACMNSCCKGCLFRMISCFICLPLYDEDEGARTSLYCSLEPSLTNTSGMYYSDSREKAAQPHATNMEIADRLWAISEELCEIK